MLRSIVCTALLCAGAVHGAPGAIPWDQLQPIPLPGQFPYGLARDGNALLCVDFKSGELFRIGLERRNVTRVGKVNVPLPSGMCSDGGTVWLISLRKTVHRLDPRTGTCTKWGVVEGKAPTGVASDGKRLFVSDRGTRQITCLSIETGKVLKRFPTPGMTPRGMTFHDGALWCVDSAERAAHRIDPETGRVTGAFMPPAGSVRGIAHVAGLWWFSDRGAKALKPTVVRGVSYGMLSDPRLVQVTFTDTLANAYPGPITNVTFRVAVPPDTQRQSIRKFEIAPEPSQYRADRFGQKIAYYRFPKVEPGKTVQVEWRAEALIWAIRYHLDGAEIGTLADVPSPIRSAFTQDAPALGLSGEAVAQAAKEAAAGARNPVTLALQLRNYGLDHLRYERKGRWDSPKVCLERGTGSCSEYSFTLCALARANGLPARFVGATVFGRPEPDANEDDAAEGGGLRFVDRVYHRWVEVYVPPVGWLPVDANRDDRKKGPYPRRYFLALPSRLLVLSKTGGWDGANLAADYRSFHTWRRGANKRGSGRVKTSRVAVWEPMQPAVPVSGAAGARQ